MDIMSIFAKLNIDLGTAAVGDLVRIEGTGVPVKATPKAGLKQVDFTYQGERWRALQQNPETNSKYARMAQAGKNVVQFLKISTETATRTDGWPETRRRQSQGQYYAVGIDGDIQLYEQRDDF